jgi:hypothetical protein
MQDSDHAQEDTAEETQLDAQLDRSQLDVENAEQILMEEITARLRRRREVSGPSSLRL